MHELESALQALHQTLPLSFLLCSPWRLFVEPTRDPGMSQGLFGIVPLNLRDAAHPTDKVLGLWADVSRVVPELWLDGNQLALKRGGTVTKHGTRIIERVMADEHLIDNYAGCVDVDFLAVVF